MTFSMDQISAFSAPNVPDDVVQAARKLLGVHASRWAMNYKRTLYVDTEQQFKDLGIALPPQLKNARYVLGWCQQAVKKPAMRTQFTGLNMPGVDDPFELGEIFEGNEFGLEFSQAVFAAYTHGCSFVTVSKGMLGEPDVQINAVSAEHGAGLWDRRTRRLSAALTITDMDDNDTPAEFTVWLPDANYVFTKQGRSWDAQVYEHTTGRVNVVAVRNDPQLGSPLGRSRLTRSVMLLNDVAVRTVARMESNAEFYSSPQIALLGVDYEAFYGDNGLSQNEKLKMAMDRLLAISRDENDNLPVLQQLSQASMVPHSDMLRSVAMLFSGETGIPPSSLGVIQDNPSSAEAIRANEHDLLIDVTRANNVTHAAAVREIATLAVMVRDDLLVAPGDAWRLSVSFADPEFRSLAAEADALTKIAPVMPTISQYPVLMERAFTPDQIERIIAGKDAQAAVVSVPNAQGEDNQGVAPDASV